MDETEVARQYYILISDLRPEKRTAAFASLSGEKNESAAALARIGKKVFDVIIGLAPVPELEGVLAEFDSFTPVAFWSRFMETTGQELIRTCYANREMDEPERREIIGHALRFISRAQDGGFPLSEFTLAQLRKVKESGGENGKSAEELIARNDMVMPEKTGGIRPPKKSGPKPKGGGRLKGVA